MINFFKISMSWKDVQTCFGLMCIVCVMNSPLFSGAEGSQLQKTLEKLTGQHTVPNVFIGEEH